MTADIPPTDDLEAWLAPKRTALIVVDMQVDFASQDGVLGKGGMDMSPAKPALEAAERLVDAARAADVRVVFVGLATDAATDSPVWREWRRRKGQGDGEAALCRAGTEGAAFFGPTPQQDELVIWKQRYSGFFDTELNDILRVLEVDTLVVCGLTTECCVDCTVRDAFHLDYFVYVPEDACAAYGAEIHETALANLALNCCTVVSAQAVEDAWAEAAPAAQAQAS